MPVTTPTRVTVSILIAKPPAEVWPLWTGAEHITHWNNASADWHCPHAENDLREEGQFLFRMAARDGSVSFDFLGTYTAVIEEKLIAYTLADGRKVEVYFAEEGAGTRVTETFDAETENTVELQRGGWQAILDNFKNYAEGQA